MRRLRFFEAIFRVIRPSVVTWVRFREGHPELAKDLVNVAFTVLDIELVLDELVDFAGRPIVPFFENSFEFVQFVVGEF